MSLLRFLYVVEIYLAVSDIQIGDKCFVEGGSGEEYLATKDRLQGYFKVIGEVSSDATWVTERMEFDEDEINRQWYDDTGVDFPWVDYERGLTLDELFEDIIIKRVQIKCSNCKHFH